MGIYIFVSVLIIVACFLQVLIVLVQNSKGGGLAANFTSAGQTMGVRKTADFLEKSTWTIAIGIFVLCLVATAAIPRGGESQNSRIQSAIDNAVDPTGESQNSRIQSAIDNAVDPNAIPTLPSANPQPAGTGTTTPQSGQEQPKK
jgi:preprotein translocase subunit SecG